MRHKKCIGTMILGAVLLLPSCSSHYPELEYPEGRGNTEKAFVTPISVFLNKQDMFSLVATRGSGSFEKGNISKKCANGLFYLFAFHSAADANLTQTLATDTANNSCLVDGTIPCYGKAARLEQDSTGTLYFVKDDDLTTRTTLYYSQKNDTVPYHFFGYYIDDFTPKADCYHRNADEIYYDLTVDGTQDVLGGYAPELTTDLLKTQYKNIMLTTAESSKILSISGYSTYAAQYGVNPVLKLKHLLTKLKFEMVAADSSADEIILRDIYIVGKNRGKMVIAARDPDKTGLTSYNTNDTMALHEPSLDGKNTGPLVSQGKGYSVKWDNSYAGKKLEDINGIRVGESIMPIPAESYEMHVTCNLVDKATGKTYLMKSTYTLTPPQNAVNYDSVAGKYLFRAGYEYTIKLGIFGQASIRISSTMDTWKSDDSIVLDPEQHL